MSIHVKDFKWEKGKNDLKYIELLEKALRNEQAVTGKALNKIRQLTTEVKSIEQTAYERGYRDGQDKGASDGAFESRNKAIDDFVKALDVTLVYCSGYPNCGEYDYAYECAYAEAKRLAKEVAVKMKQGEKIWKDEELLWEDQDVK